MDKLTVEQLQKGFHLQTGGHFNAAETLFRSVLERSPGNEFALNLMGIVCIKTGRSDDAIEFLEEALRVNHRDPETHSNLGLAYKDKHQFAKAQAALSRSIELNPNQPLVLNSLGNVLACQNKHREAIGHFESALKLLPEYADCLNNLSLSLMEERRLEPALQAIEKAVRLGPDIALFHNNKGKVLSAKGHYNEAAESYELAVALDASLIDPRINLSTALKQMGKAQEAETILKHVLKMAPHHAQAHNFLGVLYEQTGDFEQAATQFRLAIQYSPDYASAYYQLSKLKGQNLTPDEKNAISAMLESSETHDFLRGSLLFALACEAEKKQRFGESLAYLIQGNSLRAGSHGYDSSAGVHYFDAVEAVFPVRSSSDPVITSKPVPVFILGMPRSGTTLTEQIVASHSLIEGAGELSFMSDLTRKAASLVQQPFPQCCSELQPKHIKALRQEYLSRLTAFVGDAQYAVDKTPMNFHYIGFIFTVFPEAKILYCKRQAMDNCLSIFKLPFDENQSYSHDLAALGQYYRQHEKLMDLWKRMYPGQIITVNYEDTVADLESQADRMLKFIGVNFEQDVLNFYNNERLVLTPSAQQVRQPIYSNSVNASDRYGDALHPLREALESC
tara:strand:- start:60160 stop:62016 length:1857 start_codon:yes stop_codon:yes gene_type:complete